VGEREERMVLDWRTQMSTQKEVRRPQLELGTPEVRKVRRFLLVVLTLVAVTMLSATTAGEDRKAVLIVVDDSGSMGGAGGHDPQGRARQFWCEKIIDAMRSGWILEIIRFSDEAQVMLPSWTLVGQGGGIKRVCKSSLLGGGTNVLAALREGLRQFSALEGWSGPKLLFLLSDGEFPVSEELERILLEYRAQSITIYPIPITKKGGIPASLELIAAITRGNPVLDFQTLKAILSSPQMTEAVVDRFALDFVVPEKSVEGAPFSLKVAVKFGEKTLKPDDVIIIAGEASKVSIEKIMAIVDGIKDIQLVYAPGEGAFLAITDPLPVGSHLVQALVTIRLVGEAKEKTFLIASEPKIVIILSRPLLSLAVSKNQVLQNEPVVLKASVLEGIIEGETISLRAVSDNKSIPILLRRAGEGFSATIKFNSPGLYTLSPVDPLIVFERDVKIEILPPKLRIHPAETVSGGKTFLTVGADLYEPDVATITVRADPDVIRVKPPNFELSEKNPEAIVEISVGRVGFLKKLFRQKVVSTLYFTDANGILMPTTATVDLRPSAPLWVYFGLGSFPFACILIPVVIGKRRRRRRLKKGKERVFAEKATFGWGKDCDLVLPREPDIGKHHCSIKAEGNSFFLKDEAGLGTYVNGKKVNIAELNSADVIEVGKYKFQFFKEGNGFRVKTL
jgi:hypothetical protein